MTCNVLSWEIIRTVIFRRLINFFDVSSPSTEGIIMQSVKLPISFSRSIYLEAYCTVFPFNDILIYDFIRQARIGLLGCIFRIGKKRGRGGGRENETGERSFQRESFSGTARAEIGVTVTRWPTLFFRVRQTDRKRGDCGKANEVGETALSFVITVQRYIFYELRWERENERWGGGGL